MRSYSKITMDCPICGNELQINQNQRKQKCHWCNHKLVVEKDASGKRVTLEIKEYEK